MVDRILNLGLCFVFDAPGDCNLNMWTRNQQFGYRVSLLYAHLSREARPWLKIVCACLVPGKHVTHVTRERVCLVYALMTRMSINVGVLIKNVLKRARVKKGQNFGFRGLLTRFLHRHDIEEEEADYRPANDPRRIDVTEKKEPEGINGAFLSVNERNARIDNILSHLYGMQMLQLRMNGVIEEQLQQLNIDYPLSEHLQAHCRVGLGYEEPLDDDVATEDEMTRVDSDLESSDDNRRI
ncbi:hypothetical protein HAX54_031489 [Datura stramonium]|uniref:Putative plant transposon protein domain-containing protein n=1 Tax=Datura stramonium TaxID=4076 RepID=A0ABS8V9C9_DATST|nr:hypothetical protein [Datura stramonium]